MATRSLVILAGSILLLLGLLTFHRQGVPSGSLSDVAGDRPSDIADTAAPGSPSRRDPVSTALPVSRPAPQSASGPPPVVFAGRSFHPAPDAGAAWTNLVGSLAGGETAVAVAGFAGPLSQAGRARLAAAGVVPLAYLPDHGWLVRVASGAELPDRLALVHRLDGIDRVDPALFTAPASGGKPVYVHVVPDRDGTAALGFPPLPVTLPAGGPTLRARYRSRALMSWRPCCWPGTMSSTSRRAGGRG